MAGKSRSSLTSHTFPPFYACYLLKSIQTSRSKAIYIGSTPNPPRRLRQHNGELTQGASKTSKNRPWVMQMIVYGFPSRIAALQFEWAWQHPNFSRHLRAKDGGQAVFSATIRGIKMNIQVARKMISSRPYSSWPLHVNLFTSDAVKGWQDATKAVGESAPLPKGFIVTTELEGVDGKSGEPGSGRKGPIEVTDAAFTVAYLMKHNLLLRGKNNLVCSICDESLNTYASDSLTTALCPTPNCTSVSHLICLSNDFLDFQTQVGNEEEMIPRGGHCKECRQFVMWGDIVKGCYRRATGAANPIPSEVEDDPDIAKGVLTPQTTTKQKGKGKILKKPPQQLITADDNSESGEFFDLDAISSATDDDEMPLPTPKRRGRPRRVPLSPERLPTEDGLASIPGPSMPRNDPPRKAGRPRKYPYPSSLKPTTDDVSEKLPPQSPIGTGTHKGPKSAPGRPKTKTTRTREYHTAVAVPGDENREFFDLNAISAGSDDSDDGVPPAPTQMNMPARTPVPQIIRASPSRLLHVSQKSLQVTPARPIPNPAAEQSSPFAGIPHSSSLVSHLKVDHMRDALYRQGDIHSGNPLDLRGDAADFTRAFEKEAIASAFSQLSLSPGKKSLAQKIVAIEVSD